MNSRVFLSYARQDFNIVQAVYQFLRDDGRTSPWLDVQEILPTEDWEVEIRQGIENADFVILMASVFSMASEVVADEWGYALSLGKPVYIWVIAQCQLPAALQQRPGFDLRSDPFDVAHWKLILDNLLSHRSTAGETLDLSKTIIPAVISQYVALERHFQMRWVLISIGLLILLVLLGVPVFPPNVTLIGGLIILVVDTLLTFSQTTRMRRRSIPYQHVYWRTLISKLLKLAGSAILAIGALSKLQYGGDNEPGILTGLLSPCLGATYLLWMVGVGFFGMSWGKRPLPVTTNPSYGKAGDDPSLWLPYYPVAGQLAPYIEQNKESRFGLRTDAAKPMRPASEVLLLYHPVDTHFATFMTAALHVVSRQPDSAYPLQVHAHPSTRSLKSLKGYDTIAQVVSPAALPIMKRMLDKGIYAKRQLILLLLQDTPGLPDSLGQRQWIDARVDYAKTIASLSMALQGQPITFGLPPVRGSLLGLHPVPASVQGLFFSQVIFLLLAPVMQLFIWFFKPDLWPVKGQLMIVGLVAYNILVGYLLSLGYWNRNRTLLYSGLFNGMSIAVLGIGWATVYSSPLILQCCLPIFLFPTLFFLSRRLRKLNWFMGDSTVATQGDMIDIWKPKKRFEWGRLLLIVLFNAIFLLALNEGRNLPTTVQAHETISVPLSGFWSWDSYTFQAEAGSHIVFEAADNSLVGGNNVFTMANVNLELYDSSGVMVRNMDLTENEVSEGDSLTLVLDKTDYYTLILRLDGGTPGKCTFTLS